MARMPVFPRCIAPTMVGLKQAPPAKTRDQVDQRPARLGVLTLGHQGARTLGKRPISDGPAPD